MKKKILIVLLFIPLLFCVVQSDAQVSFRGNQGVYPYYDTLVNTDADTLYYTTVGTYAHLGIQPVVTKASGTMAGVVKVFASINGTNYIATGDTLALTNVTTNTILWTYDNPYRYWMLTFSGATTVTGTFAAKLSAATY